MTHRVRQRAIFALLDGTLERHAAKELEKHLEECEECSVFLEKVSSAQNVMRDFAAQSPPPIDWSRVDAGVDAGIEANNRARTPLLSGLFLWGSLAAATAAAFIITWLVASGPTDTPSIAEPAQKAPVANVEHPTTTSGEEAPVTVEAFVSFIAGEASVSDRDGNFEALNLDSALSAGSRLRTAERGTLGVQLGTQSACRVEPESEVQLASLGSPALRLDLQRGRAVCETAGDDDEPPLVLAVMDVVASAEGSTRFALQRTPQVVVIELAEGTLHVDRENDGPTLDAPGRYIISRDETGALRAARDGEQDGATLAEVALMARRSIASLQIPNIDIVDRVQVDGVEYGALPLSLRRRPGVARIEMFVEGREPIVHEIEVGLGPRVVEVASLELEPSAPETRARPSERRVAPRYGTYSKTQVARLRSIVGRQVRSCYERALKRNPSIWGRIAVRFTVSTTGEARSINVSSLAGGHADVNRCIKASISRNSFPPPTGGRIPIEQTITLSPQF